MKIHSTFCFILSLLFFDTYAQITFEKTIGSDSGEVGYNIIQTSDGGFFVSGTTLSFGAGDFENYFVRTDSLGNVVWIKTLGGTARETITKVLQTADGGFLAGGVTNSIGAVPYDIFLIRMDANGDTTWTRTYGGTNEEGFGSVMQTNDGGFIVTGFSRSFSLSDHVYLLRLDSGGNVLWERTFGGSSSEEGVGVFQTSDSGFIICGNTGSFGSGYLDVYLIKTDANGSVLWSKTYGGVDWDEVKGFYPTSDGGYVISGITVDLNVDKYVALVIRTDNNGDTLWTRSYNTRENDFVNCIIQSAADDFLLAGYAFDSALVLPIHASLINLDLNGEPQWAKSYGGAGLEIFYDIIETVDGGFALTGHSNSFDTAEGRLYFIKTDASGSSFCNDATATIVSVDIPITLSIPATVETTVAGTVGNPAFTISTGGNDSTLCSSIGIEEIVSGMVMNVYPNPANDQIKIIYSGIAAKNIEIFNLLGTKIMNVVPGKSYNEQTIDIGDLQSGIYFISLTSDNGTAVKKLIKQ